MISESDIYASYEMISESALQNQLYFLGPLQPCLNVEKMLIFTISNLYMPNRGFTGGSPIRTATCFTECHIISITPIIRSYATPVKDSLLSNSKFAVRKIVHIAFLRD